MELAGTDLPLRPRTRIDELQSDRDLRVDFEGCSARMNCTSRETPNRSRSPVTRRSRGPGTVRICGVTCLPLRRRQSPHSSEAGKWRDADGRLDPCGRYLNVVDGVVGDTEYQVRGPNGGDLLVREPAGRNKAQAFRVTVFQRGVGREAVLEYLSTDAWDSHDAGAGDVMGRMAGDAPSVTVRTEFFKPEKGRYLHPTEQRPITHYEAYRPCVPEEFLWCGSKTAIAPSRSGTRCRSCWQSDR